MNKDGGFQRRNAGEECGSEDCRALLHTNTFNDSRASVNPAVAVAVTYFVFTDR
jgi:hypothetical protein